MPYPHHIVDRQTRRSRLFGLACVCIGLGCGLDSDRPNVGGELNAGIFEYHCADASDAFYPCADDQYFPETIALGSHFGMRFFAEQVIQNDSSDLPLQSASPLKLAAVGSSTFRADMEGYVAVLAYHRSGVVDFIHIFVEAVGRVGLRLVDGTTDLDELWMAPGETRDIIAIPYAAESRQVAAGSLAYQWESSGDSSARILSDPTQRQVQIRAEKAGTTVLTAYQGSVQRSIQIHVEARSGESEKAVDP